MASRLRLPYAAAAKRPQQYATSRGRSPLTFDLMRRNKASQQGVDSPRDLLFPSEIAKFSPLLNFPPRSSPCSRPPHRTTRHEPIPVSSFPPASRIGLSPDMSTTTANSCRPSHGIRSMRNDQVSLPATPDSYPLQVTLAHSRTSC
jgi:hypothetical protein